MARREGVMWGMGCAGGTLGWAGGGDSGLQFLSQRGSLPGWGGGCGCRDEEEEEVMEEMRCGLCWGSGPALWVEGLGLRTGCCG